MTMTASLIYSGILGIIGIYLAVAGLQLKQRALFGGDFLRFIGRLMSAAAGGFLAEGLFIRYGSGNKALEILCVSLLGSLVGSLTWWITRHFQHPAEPSSAPEGCDE